MNDQIPQQAPGKIARSGRIYARAAAALFAIDSGVTWVHNPSDWPLAVVWGALALVFLVTGR